MAQVLDLIKHYQHAIEKYPDDEKKLLRSIEKLHQLDVTVRHLEETGVGRTVNALRKEPGNVGEAARALVKEWKYMVASEERSESEDYNCETTHSNGHGSGGDSDYGSQSKNYKDQYNEKKSSKDQDHQVNGDHNSGKRKYHSSEDEEHQTKKTCQSYTKEQNKHTKSANHIKTESDSETQNSDSDSEYTEDDEDSKPKVKEERQSPRQTSNQYVDEKRSGSYSSKKMVHELSEKQLKSHKSDDKHSSSKSSSREKPSSSHSKDKHSEHEDNADKKNKSYKSSSSKLSSSSDKPHNTDKEERQKQKSSSTKYESKTSESHHKSHRSDETSKHKHSSDKETPKDKDKYKENHKDKHSSSNSSKSKDKSSSREKSSHSNKDNIRHSSGSDMKSKSSESRSKSSSSSKEKESKHSSSSSTSKSSNKSSSSKLKEDVPKKRKSIEKSADSDDGIDCGSGASFAEALGMVSPVKVKKKSTLKDVLSPSSSDLSPAALLAPSTKLEPLPPIEISALPEISPHYKPMPPPKLLPHFTEDDAMNAVISSKNQRTKVYSGNKTVGKVYSLYELCVQVLQEHIDSLEYTGGVPYEILKPVVDRATPEQLFLLEHYNPYLMEDTDHLWQAFCVRRFRNKRRAELETWRDMYIRSQEEQEHKLKSLTANIKMAQDIKNAPVKQTKMAYVDSAVKPPRNIARKQAIHGTARAAAASPAARVPALGVAAVRPSPASLMAPATTAAFLQRPKKAPLMQKALQFMRGRKR